MVFVNCPYSSGMAFLKLALSKRELVTCVQRILKMSTVISSVFRAVISLVLIVKPLSFIGGLCYNSCSPLWLLSRVACPAGGGAFLFAWGSSAAVGFKHLCTPGNLNLPYPVPLLCGVLGSAFAYFVRFRPPFVVSIILPSVDIVNMSFSTNILPSYCLFCLLPSVATCAIIAIVEKGLSLAPLPAYIERGV